ncbi:hypothetical protein GIB67_004956 [Kingdonia uniflora]|uniref:Uncharacterized protein n=1 Tax=Kingdonia uniflora TaxID=39325 RepID=A0A7J7NN52_9MAGN|nr:hypothetical protein GIB67_004956 [Kingdonia uniflora]
MFGFDDSSRVFNLLSPNGAFYNSKFSVDRYELVKYVIPVERLPEWVRFMFQNKRDCHVLSELCLLFKGRVKVDSSKSGCYQVQLNVFKYYMFWFAYYPVCKGNNESLDTGPYRSSLLHYSLRWLKFILTFSVERDSSSLAKTLLDLFLEINSDEGSLSTESMGTLLEIHLLNKTVKRKCRNMVNLLVQYSLNSSTDFSRKYLFFQNQAGLGGVTPLHLTACMNDSEHIVDALINDPQEEALYFDNVSEDSVKKPKSIVDVGCGISGPEIYLAKTYGAKCIGIDISPYKVKRGTEIPNAQGLGDKVMF